MSLLSVVIPSRNEPYLSKTIRDVLEKATEAIEVIAVVDGYWPTDIVADKRVHYIHFPTSQGMRRSINAGVTLSRGEYILKCDAHVMFEKGFDAVLKADCTNDTVLIPRRKRLDPDSWSLTNTHKPDVDVMSLSFDLHGEDWQKGNDPSLLIQDTPSSQGSCWIMKKTYFRFLELLDEETYGTFWNEMQEIGLKCWLSGGAMRVHKGTWYAHWHKTKSRGYSLSPADKEKAERAMTAWKSGTAWHKQILPLRFFGLKFPDMPGWDNVRQ